ncbi:hypothetical protein FBY03_10569 [Pseudomonas sp. SJZ079]|uniref:hypothetical protein n=1 Tax=Pseudomonas sp. SJZ079 TaxID=2572887 RepID=UPI00119B7566|nr:hypothetical protein [Pseudomonas sp. SJZ079]TWC38943.1 hypothetical protein FBY03_10569 [Pseudomonas sp. SJZ079]
MHTRISILALATVLLLMTGCAYHEYNGRAGGYYRDGDRHQSARIQTHRQHRYEYRNHERDDRRRPDREDSRRHHR